MRPKLSLAIPVYNEEACLQQSIDDLTETFKENDIPYELVLVNNGSLDSSHRILERQTDPGIKVVTLEKNEGFGGGVIAGFKECTGDIIGFNCADGQVPVREVVRLYNITCEPEVLICKGDRTTNYEQFIRRFYSRGYNLLVRLLFNINVRDINGYPVLIKKSVFPQVMPTVKNWILQVEMLHNCKLYGYPVREEVIDYGERKAGQSNINFSQVINFFTTILDYRIHSAKKAREVEQWKRNRKSSSSVVVEEQD